MRLILFLGIWIGVWNHWLIGLSHGEELTPEIIKRGSELYRNLTKLGLDNINDCEEGQKLTEISELFLLTSYPGLWQYRRHVHDYSDLEYGDLKDSPSYTGTVYLRNYQDGSLYLKCPCTEGSGEYKWKMYGRGSKEFNKKGGGNKVMLRIKAPPQRFYYWTYSCRKGSQLHYFNVFVRPLGLTSNPPLMFTEKLPSPASSDSSVDCSLAMYQNLEEKPELWRYIPAPFTFYWQIPKFGKDGDALYWGKQGDLEANEPDEQLGLTITADEVKGSKICKKTKIGDNFGNVALKSTMSIKDPGVDHMGTYACIVVDVNGLSSAYWWDVVDLETTCDDSKGLIPRKPFRGFTTIRVREFKYVIMGLLLFGIILILTALMICCLPDNKDDFAAEPKHEPEHHPEPEPEPEEEIPETKPIPPKPKPSSTPSHAAVVPKASNAGVTPTPAAPKPSITAKPVGSVSSLSKLHPKKSQSVGKMKKDSMKKRPGSQ